MADFKTFEEYGKAWRMIVCQNQKQHGLAVMQDLDKQGFSEATVVLAMFEENVKKREALLLKAADAGNIEGIWEYCTCLPHSYCPDPKNKEDVHWEELCLKAAIGGSVDAMNEMGNVFHRRKRYAESMYWYAMANAHGKNDGLISMQGLSKEWFSAGCPEQYDESISLISEIQFKCAIAYLEIYAGMKISIDFQDIISGALSGVPIAGYLAGDVFESQNDKEDAYKVYHALANNSDPHGMRCVAEMLFEGRGIGKDIDSAITLFYSAALAGEREAMFIAGEFLRDNNQNLAAYWYGLSHTRGYELALQRLCQLAV